MIIKMMVLLPVVDILKVWKIRVSYGYLEFHHLLQSAIIEEIVRRVDP